MRLFTTAKRKRLLGSFVGGVILHGFYKLYLYTNDREQFEDSNMLVALVFILLAASVIFIVSGIISRLKLP